MRKLLPFLFTIAIAQCPNIGAQDNTKAAATGNTVGGTVYGISYREFLDTMNQVMREHSESPFQPGATRAAREIVAGIRPLLNHKELLAPIAAGVLHLDEGTIQVASGPGAPRPEGGKQQIISLNVEPAGQAANLRFSFSPPISIDDSRVIIHRYLEKVAPDAKKFSEKFFNEHFQPAMEEADKQLNMAQQVAAQLENDRRNFQLRSYEELPYEKVADHLADLQRQQLALKLSLVGMEAREEEIRNQLAEAKAVLKTRQEEAAKVAESDEMVDTLKQLVKMRTDQVDFLKKQTEAGIAHVTQAEVTDAMAKMLEAKVQLLSLVNKKQPQPNHEQLDSLQMEYTRIQIDHRESQAKLEYLAKLQDETRDRIARRASLDQEIKRIDDQLPEAKQKLRAAEARIQELKDAKANFRPIELTRGEE